MKPETVVLALMTVALGVIAACTAIRLSAPHVRNGKMALRIVLAIVLYAMVKTCWAVFATLTQTPGL